MAGRNAHGFDPAPPKRCAEASRLTTSGQPNHHERKSVLVVFTGTKLVWPLVVPNGIIIYMNGIRILVLMAISCLLLFISCGKEKKEPVPPMTARLIEENHQLFIVLHNSSDSALVICRRNFYDPIQCLDVRKAADTSEFSTDLLFGGVQSGVIRSIITLDDFVSLDTGAEVRLPVDLRPVRKDAGAGRPVLIRVYFKNIDPLSCSKVDVTRFDKMIQNYCTLMHYVPNPKLHYWIGEVRTPYCPVNLAYYVVRQQQIVKKRAQPVMIRKSRTHPLTKRVF
ncbi:MAG: hypothetical protein ABSF80_00470 [Chitinispirillaceae bacterium]